MSKEDLEKMMKDPKFAEMFKNMGGANPFANASTTPPPANDKPADDNVVDAEVSE